MKKYLSLLLAAMLLLGCAMAETLTIDGTNMEVKTIEDEAKFEESFAYNGDATNEATANTDVWLQVVASGQIDVTVPLVVVFKTNIDGGEATTGTNYKIVNNSTAALKVTQVQIVDKQYEFTQNQVAEKMEMVDELKDTDYNKYTLTMVPADKYKVNPWTVAVNVADANLQKFAKSGNTYTYKQGTIAEQPGLFRIEKDDQATGGDDECHIKLCLETSDLTFVTRNPDEDTIQHGIHLLSITYTVAIDDSTAVGEDIKGSFTDGDNTTHSYEVK